MKKIWNFILVFLGFRVRYSADALMEIIGSQIKTLRERGCSENVLDELRQVAESAIKKAVTMVFKEGRIPVLAVIPKNIISISDQMKMVRNGEEVGSNYLYETTDVIQTLAEPYYIFDVEDGVGVLGKSVFDCEEIVVNQGRRFMTDVEVISLGIHTNVLSKHYVYAGGSRYKSFLAPHLYLSDDDKPSLNYVHLSNGFDRWGSASCSK